MSTDAPDHDALRIEIERLELEAKRLELEIKHEELRNQRQSRPRFVLSPVWIPLLASRCATPVNQRDEARNQSRRAPARTEGSGAV